MFKLLCFALLAGSLLSEVYSFKILAVFPHTGRSHHMIFEPLLRALAEKGHEVTAVSHFSMKNPPPTYTDVSVEGSRKVNMHICTFDDFSINGPVDVVMQHVAAVYELFDLGNLNCKAMMNHENVKKFISSNATFDVIITEQFNSDCAMGIISKFKSPVIGIATHVPMPWTRDRFGIPDNPAFVPSHFAKHSKIIDFWQALEAFVLNMYYRIAYFVNVQFLEYQYLKDVFMKPIEDFGEFAKNMSLLMVTTYFPLHGANPQPQNVVEIGGLHISKTKKPLDLDMETYLNKSENGVIYFSMGSMIRGNSLPMDKLKAFQEAFAQLPYEVLWKWENDTMPGKTDNIKIKQWMPQFEILSHPNVKVFISHGGLLGVTEAVHLGVPVLVIPFFGDQFINGAAAEDSGVGKVLRYEDITADSILKSLRTLLSPKYQENAKRMSLLWNDRPLPPLETAIYWVEHVARHGGKHLRPQSLDIPFYRYYLLDVVGFLVLLVLAVSYILYKTCIFVVRGSGKTKSKKE